MSRSLLSTAASICFGSLLLLGCQPTESGSSGTTEAPTTTVAANNGDGDGNQGDGNGDNNGGNTGDAAASAAVSCDALRAADARLTDLSMILGNLTQPVLDQAREGDAGGLDPRTMGKTMGVIQPLAEPGSEMATSVAALQPVFDLLATSLRADVALSPTALSDLQAGGGVVAAVADKLQDVLKDKCPAQDEAPESGPTSTGAPTTTTDVPTTTEAPATTEAPTTSEAPTTTTQPELVR